MGSTAFSQGTVYYSTDIILNRICLVFTVGRFGLNAWMKALQTEATKIKCQTLKRYKSF